MAHPVEYNAGIVVADKKRRWNIEEIRLLARAEIEAEKQGVRFMNQHLLELFPDRSLEAIKGKRRQADYRRTLTEMRSELAPGTPASSRASPRVRTISVSSDESSDSAPPDDLGEIRAATGSLVGEVSGKQLGFESPQLCEIALRACGGENTSQDLLAWLGSVFPTNYRGPRPDVRNDDPPTEGERKLSRVEARRREYARVQQIYKHDQRAAVGRILDDEVDVDGGYPCPPVDFADFWQRVFETPSQERTNPQPPPPPVIHHQLWAPITPEEIRSVRLGARKAAGPDRVSVSQWTSVPADVVALFYNCVMLNGGLPAELTCSRTVFLKKTKQPTAPGDYRPISIGSVIARQLHKLIASRLQRIPGLLDERQRAFRGGVDGVAENLSVLSALLHLSRSQIRTLHLASVDVSKAFDTVSHEAIVDACVRAGCPPRMVEYIRSVYADSSTILEVNRGCRYVRTLRGVKQGDPLSPLVFNLVVDHALKTLSPEVGFDVDGTKVSALVFADDVILIGTTTVGLQLNLELLTTALRNDGLRLNAAKSHALSLVAAGKTKRVKVVTDPTFFVDGQYLQQIEPLQLWRYLGVEFEGVRVAGSRVSIAGYLEKLTRAPLKPQQRMHILRSFLLPRLYHGLVLGRVSAGYLQSLDVRIRASVRKWLCLPKDVPVGYLHASTRAGGLGVPHLGSLIPLLRLRRLTAMRQSPADFVRAVAVNNVTDVKLRWCGERLPSGVSEAADPRRALARYWAERLHTSADGEPLRESERVPASTDWLRSVTRVYPAKDWMHCLSVHANALPSRRRTTRGREGRDDRCRGGCGETETAAHVIQRCFRTHCGRVQRHDTIVNRLAEGLKQVDWEIWKEHRFQTDVGPRIPDLIAIRPDRVVVIDAQVVGGKLSLDLQHRRKTAKYRDEAALAPKVREAVLPMGIRNPEVVFASATISWRGVWSGESAQSLQALGLGRKVLSGLSYAAIVGSWVNWVRFNGSTSTRMGRRGVEE